MHSFSNLSYYPMFQNFGYMCICVCTDTLDSRSLLIRHKNGLLVQGQGAVTHWISEQQSRAMDPNIKKMCLNFTTFSLIEKGKMYYAHFYYCTALYSYLRIRVSALFVFWLYYFIILILIVQKIKKEKKKNIPSVRLAKRSPITTTENTQMNHFMSFCRWDNYWRIIYILRSRNIYILAYLGEILPLASNVSIFH